MGQDGRQGSQVGRLEHEPEGAFHVEMMSNSRDYPRRKQRLVTQVEKIVKDADIANTQLLELNSCKLRLNGDRGPTCSRRSRLP